jgi:hypothetical protein
MEVPVMWAVWFVTYAFYEDVARDGDIPPRLVQRGLSLDAAKRLADRLGFGHCVKPEGVA